MQRGEGDGKSIRFTADGSPDRGSSVLERQYPGLLEPDREDDLRRTQSDAVRQCASVCVAERCDGRRSDRLLGCEILLRILAAHNRDRYGPPEYVVVFRI